MRSITMIIECSRSNELKERGHQAIKDGYDAQAALQGLNNRDTDQIQRKWTALVLDFKEEFTRRNLSGASGSTENPVYDRLEPILKKYPTILAPYTYNSHHGGFVDNTVQRNEVPSTSTTTPLHPSPAVESDRPTSISRTSDHGSGRGSASASASASVGRGRGRGSGSVNVSVGRGNALPNTIPTPPLTSPSPSPAPAPFTRYHIPTPSITSFNSLPPLLPSLPQSPSAFRPFSAIPSSRETTPARPRTIDFSEFENILQRQTDRAQVRIDERYEELKKMHEENLNVSAQFYELARAGLEANNENRRREQEK